MTNELGEVEAAVLGDDATLMRLALTRNAWDNFAGRARSNLQRVSWWLDDGEVRRAYWPVLDRASELPMIDATVLSEVSEFEVRYLADRRSNVEGAWKFDWPVDGAAATTLPLAVEVSIEIEDWGRATRVFLPAGAF